MKKLTVFSTFFSIYRLLLRILPASASKVGTDLGVKYGCSNEKAKRLLQIAKTKGQRVIGVW